MIIMTGLIIAIKDNSFLTLSSIAALIFVLHIFLCHKVPLLRLRLTNYIDRYPRMFINAGVNIKVYVFDIKVNYRQFESCHK